MTEQGVNGTVVVEVSPSPLIEAPGAQEIVLEM